MIDAQERVILLDDSNRPCGTAEKLTAHRLGLRHRAFSVFIVDDAGRILLQRRALSKYHSGGLWANTCCGHPRPDEETTSAAERRLREEMGISTSLVPVGSFLYHAAVGDALIEHEYDYLFLGKFDADPQPCPTEVMEWRWESERETRSRIAATPRDFAVWLPPALDALRASTIGK